MTHSNLIQQIEATQTRYQTIDPLRPSGQNVHSQAHIARLAKPVPQRKKSAASAGRWVTKRGSMPVAGAAGSNLQMYLSTAKSFFKHGEATTHQGSGKSPPPRVEPRQIYSMQQAQRQHQRTHTAGIVSGGAEANAPHFYTTNTNDSKLIGAFAQSLPSGPLSQAEQRDRTLSELDNDQNEGQNVPIQQMA